MKRAIKMKRYYVLIIILLYTAPAFAETGTAGGAAPILRYGVGARAFGMGGAFIAIAEDPSAVYWNPAGLSRLKNPMLATMHSEMFGSTQYDYIGWAAPVKYGGFGINILNYETPLEELTDSYIRAFYLGYGWEYKGWRMGVTGKYFQEVLPGENLSSLGMDVGVQKDLTDHFRLGMVVQDLADTTLKFSSSHEEEIPANYRMGLIYTREKLLLAFEIERALDFQESHFGFEYAVNDLVKIRSGLRGKDITAGMGISYNTWTFDYAYCAHDLTNTHRVSFGVAFK